MLIGLNGDAGAGKDTIAKALIDNWGFKRYAFADALREAALALDPKIEWWPDGGYLTLSDEVREFGWDFAKRHNPEVRRILQALGTEVGRQILGENCWVDIVARQWAIDGMPDAVITDMRFPNEHTWLLANEGIPVKVLRPNNPDAIGKGHISEQYALPCDYTLTNNAGANPTEKDLRELYGAVNNLIGTLKEQPW